MNKQENLPVGDASFATSNFLAAAMATIAAFSKSFVPFQFFGSNGIFLSTLILALLFAALNSRAHAPVLVGLQGYLGVTVTFFSLACLNFMMVTGGTVPTTYLIGMLGMLPTFLLLGILASSNIRATFHVFLSFALIYFLYLALFLLQNGTLYPNGYFGDVFGLTGTELNSGAETSQLYQNVGIFLGAGLIALIFTNFDELPKPFLQWGLVMIGAAVFGMILLAQARGAFVGLCVAIMIQFGKSRMWRGAGLALSALLLVLLWALAHEVQISDIPVLSRTVNELAHPPAGSRWYLTRFALDSIWNNLDMLVAGRGLGMFPVDIGAAAPDWLLAPHGVSLYPHNSILEALYELGVAGCLLYVLMTIRPLYLHYKNRTSSTEVNAVVTMYIYFFTMEMFSGALAYSFSFFFILGLTMGTLARKSLIDNSPSACLDHAT